MIKAIQHQSQSEKLEDGLQENLLMNRQRNWKPSSTQDILYDVRTEEKVQGSAAKTSCSVTNAKPGSEFCGSRVPIDLNAIKLGFNDDTDKNEQYETSRLKNNTQTSTIASLDSLNVLLDSSKSFKNLPKLEKSLLNDSKRPFYLISQQNSCKSLRGGTPESYDQANSYLKLAAKLTRYKDKMLNDQTLKNELSVY